CAIGVCYTRGAECTRCHGRNTLPGVRLKCRGGVGEALAYGASLAIWQRRLLEQADAVIVPSVFARERLRELGAPLPWERVHVLAPPLRALDEPRPEAQAGPPEDSANPYALVVARLAPEKGIDVAIDACGQIGLPLVVAGEGPEREALGARVGTAEVQLLGRVDQERLARLRAGAAVAVVPSRAAETFGLAAAEAMASGLPVAASRVGALPELVEEQGLAEPGDADALAGAIARQLADAHARERARERVRGVCAPEQIAPRLARIYAGGGGS
ncbi:MAG TPA: glycosyltransferase family 4 protein, partial [Solirubrobacteraceae bacterium]|nr:glycosyltransferase family 4 protein [Solirubrobacteraceae bacterium]